MNKPIRVPFGQAPKPSATPSREMIAKHSQRVAQPKVAAPPAHRPTPPAPPVYRPQPLKPKVAQPKVVGTRAGIFTSRPGVKSTPVYRPQPVQTKMAAPTPRVLQPQKPARAAAPVYRPQPAQKVLQKKTLATGRQAPSAQLKVAAPVRSQSPVLKTRTLQPSRPAIGSVRPVATKTTGYGAIQRKEFTFRGGTYHGIDPQDCQAFMARQEKKDTCWAAVLSNVQGMLDVDPKGEEAMIACARRSLGEGTDDDMTYLIKKGASPSSYQEIINVMKEEIGIRTQGVAWNEENRQQIFDHVRRAEKPVIVGNEADEPHVVILLAVGATAGGVDGVLFYDTATGDFREASHAAFKSNNPKSAFLMDKYKKESKEAKLKGSSSQQSAKVHS